MILLFDLMVTPYQHNSSEVKVQISQNYEFWIPSEQAFSVVVFFILYVFGCNHGIWFNSTSPLTSLLHKYNPLKMSFNPLRYLLLNTK